MASRPPLPERRTGSRCPREEILACAPRGVPRPHVPRLLLPEGGDGAARHALHDRAGRARLRARHARALPRDVRALARGRAPLRHEDRDLRGPDARRARPRCTATSSGSASPISAARSARSSRSPARSAASTPGSPVSAATSRRRAPTTPKVGWDEAHELWKAARSPTGATRAAGTTSASTTCPTTPLHDRGYASIGCTHCTPPGAGRDGRWAATDEDRVRAARPRGASERPARRPVHAEPSRRARGGGDPHHARGRRRARAAGAALLRRQGLDRPAAARREGVPARQVPVPGDARRHRPQLPRGDRVPRPPRRRARGAPRRRERAGLDRPRARRRADGPRASRNLLQTTTLLDAIEEHGFDAAMGGARRDEERSRAKERIFSFRDDFGQWNPRAQRPELWNLYNGRIRKGEHIRVFPISNWTELDVWQYIARENLELPSIYFAHERRGVPPRRDALRRRRVRGAARPARSRSLTWVRFRTVGDMTCTGGVESRRRDDRRGRRRDRGDQRHRARRDPRRRPRQRGRDGGPQARWLLLSR